MPTFARFAFEALACHGGVKFDHRLASFDRRIRSTGDDAPALNECLPGVRACQPIDSEPSRREKQIADRMRGLHRWDYTKFSEPRDVGWIHNLRVLDTPAPVANLSFVWRHVFERLLVKIENKPVGAIADRVRFYLDTAP